MWLIISIHKLITPDSVEDPELCICQQNSAEVSRATPVYSSRGSGSLVFKCQAKPEAGSTI